MVSPTTLEASDSTGGPATIAFTRVIVMPDGHKYIEGVTPKQLPAPSHALPNEPGFQDDTKENNDL
jgi:hypothetical protein